ncbi:MAG: hypothetical protein FD167_167 [bacterium]|nr:MAG: hypothetical protein FD167_167 [bacterium]
MITLATLASMSMLLAFQLPGFSGIPGVPTDYFPPAAMDLGVELHKIMFKEARTLALALLVVTGGIVAIGSYMGKEFSLQETVIKVIGTFLLLYAINPIFGLTIQAGAAISYKIMSPEEIQRVNKDFNKAAEQQEKTKENKIADLSKFGWIKSVASLASGIQNALVAGVLYTLISLVYFLVTQGVIIIWKVLALVLYAFAPLCIALGVIPTFGTRIMFAWYGAVVQLSALQIWIAFCGFCVKYANTLFFSSFDISSRTDFLDPSLQFNSVAIAFVFTILQILGFIFIGKLIPTSDFVSTGGTAITLITSKVFNTAVSAGKTAAGAAL